MVYAADHLPLDRTVAIKALKPSLTGPALDALVEEARIAGGLEHPTSPRCTPSAGTPTAARCW